jgi:hypothetical protein
VIGVVLYYSISIHEIVIKFYMSNDSCPMIQVLLLMYIYYIKYSALIIEISSTDKTDNLTCAIIYDNLTCENYRFSIIYRFSAKNYIAFQRLSFI